MEKREKTINGRNYQLLVPSVRPYGMNLCTRVTTLIGPSIVSGGSALMKESSEGWQSLGKALEGVDPIKVDALMMDAVKAAHVCYEGKPINDDLEFTRHFNAYRVDTYPVCIWALWESVKDFLPEWTDLQKLIEKGQAVPAFQSPKAGQRTTG